MIFDCRFVSILPNWWSTNGKSREAVKKMRIVEHGNPNLGLVFELFCREISGAGECMFMILASGKFVRVKTMVLRSTISCCVCVRGLHLNGEKVGAAVVFIGCVEHQKLKIIENSCLYVKAKEAEMKLNCN